MEKSFLLSPKFLNYPWENERQDKKIAEEKQIRNKRIKKRMERLRERKEKNRTERRCKCLPPQSTAFDGDY